MFKTIGRVFLGACVLVSVFTGCAMEDDEDEAVLVQDVRPPPTTVNAMATATDRITVSWSAVTQASKYYVYQSTGTVGPFNFKGTTLAPGTSLLVANLAPNTNYCFTVRTDGFDGPGPMSVVACADTGTIVGPGVPTGVMGVLNADETRATVSWAAVSGATKYYVYQSQNGGAGPFAYRTSSLGTGVQIAGLTPGGDYCWRVAAVSSAGVSMQSAASCATPSLCPNGTVDSGEQCDDNNSTNGDGCSDTCQTEAPFFSEYVEGSSFNKALEIKNPLTASLNLANCNLRSYVNGSTTPQPAAGTALTGTLAGGGVFVICNTMFSTGSIGLCNATSGATPLSFNGNDAVELRCNGVVLDVIGQIGNNPGTEWGSGLWSTADNTLRRRCGITSGDANGADAFTPMVQWGGFANDTFSDLGMPSCSP